MTSYIPAKGLVLGLFLSLLAVFPAQSMETELDTAKQHVESLGREALASLQAPQMTPADREVTLAAVLREGVAVDLIGRFALGRHWRAATPAERGTYQELFRTYVVKTYAGYLNGLTDTSFTVVQAVPVGERDVLVTTEIDRPDGGQVQAGWRVRNIDGNYKVIDVVFQGVSLATAQRQEFSAVVGHRGVAGLLDVLHAKTQTTTASR